MYKIVKEYGTSENVYLQNTDTMAEINLGRMTPTMIHILEADGYTFETITEKEGEKILLKEKWNLKVSDEVKEQLRKLAMPMKKPIRDQSKKATDTPKKEIVDVLDIIYGLNK